MATPVAIFAVIAPFFLIALAVGLFIAVFPVWWMFKRAGVQPMLSLLVLIPLLGWGVLLWFAYADWPAERQGMEGPR